MDKTPAPGSGSNPRAAQPNLTVTNDIFGMELRELSITEQKAALQNEIDKLEAIENADTVVSELPDVTVIEEDEEYPFKIGYELFDLPYLPPRHSSNFEEEQAADLTKSYRDFLNQKGKEGWILCSIQSGYGVFMRLDPNEEILK